MSACTRGGQWQQAIEAFAAMEAEDIIPDVLAYNSAISACAAAGAWDRGWALFGGARPQLFLHWMWCVFTLSSC